MIWALIVCAMLITAECAAPGPECGCTCKRNLKPVCGKTSDGELKQFGNECLLECENRCYSKSKKSQKILRIRKICLIFKFSDFAEVELTECKK